MLTTAKGINKSDANQLMNQFGCFKNVVNATAPDKIDQIENLPGMGGTKIDNLRAIFQQPFRLDDDGKAVVKSRNPPKPAAPKTNSILEFLKKQQAAAELKASTTPKSKKPKAKPKTQRTPLQMQSASVSSVKKNKAAVIEVDSD